MVLWKDAEFCKEKHNIYLFHKKTGNLEAIPCLGKIASLRNIAVVVVVTNKQRCPVSGHLEEEDRNGLE